MGRKYLRLEATKVNFNNAEPYVSYGLSSASSDLSSKLQASANKVGSSKVNFSNADDNPTPRDTGMMTTSIADKVKSIAASKGINYPPNKTKDDAVSPPISQNNKGLDSLKKFSDDFAASSRRRQTADVVAQTRQKPPTPIDKGDNFKSAPVNKQPSPAAEPVQQKTVEPKSNIPLPKARPNVGNAGQKFGDAFAQAVKSGARTFTWRNPKTGKIATFNTKRK